MRPHDGSRGDRPTRGEGNARVSLPRFKLGIPAVLFSMKFAIWIAVILALASVAGVLIQEFFPVRDARQAEMLSQRLPAPAFQLFMLLQLHDPFRALWFKTLLGLLALSVGLCAIKNFRPNFRQAFTVQPLSEPRALLALPDAATLHHATPDLFERVVAQLRRRLYVGSVRTGDTEKVAALHYGGLSRTGPVILHIGILVLVLGGLATSIVGRRFVLYGGPGETMALDGSRYALRVDDFQIEENDQGQVKQYRSQLAVLDGDREVQRQEISVNHPLRFAGYNIYQASYQTDPTRAASLALVVRPRLEDDATAHAHGHGGASAPATGSPLQATMDTTFPVPGQDGYELRVRRFFAHLQITDEGPVNASRDLVNPAAEIEILRDGAVVGTQWAFMRFPPHARADVPFVVELHDVRPAMATGLEVNTNPGAPLVWLGFLLATLGLVFTFLVRHRTIYVVARPAERGWTLWMAGRSERERVAFSNEFERLVRQVHAEARRLKKSTPHGPAAPPPSDAQDAGAVVGAAPTER